MIIIPLLLIAVIPVFIVFSIEMHINRRTFIAVYVLVVKIFYVIGNVVNTMFCDCRNQSLYSQAVVYYELKHNSEPDRSDCYEVSPIFTLIIFF